MDPLTVAGECAREAGAMLLEHFGRHLAYEEKARRADLVTAADRSSEDLIVKRIRAATPNATIVGEETGVHPGTSDERWFIDPLDGTTNFAHTYPLFCISIGYERGGELLAGVIYAPKLGEFYAAERGGGARLNDTPIHVSAVERVADALLCTGFVPADFEVNLPYFAAMSAVAHAVRRDGAAALDLAFVAAGRFDAFWEFGLHAWDVAAGTLIVREARGKVSAIDGGGLDYFGGTILATNDRIHTEMSERLTSVLGRL